MFEASVGGGIPIIRPLNECLTSEQILEINGIVNGTTNYILTKMSREGATFEAALKEAQDLGYAERNPEADVEGHDAGRKLAILASLSPSAAKIIAWLSPSARVIAAAGGDAPVEGMHNKLIIKGDDSDQR